MNDSIYTFEAEDNSGKKVNLNEYKGKTLLVVNTASKCGFTPQYEGLQKLYSSYKDKGLEILAFPCDQFAHQEPGDDQQIKEFCQINYGVTFPLFKKINVNGPNAHPLFKYLTKTLPGAIGKRVKWNFTKFLIGPDGQPVKRFAPNTEPEALAEDIEKALGA